MLRLIFHQGIRPRAIGIDLGTTNVCLATMEG